MSTEMTEKIYNALNGDYQERDPKVLGKRQYFRGKGDSQDIAHFFNDQRPFLEAMVLIPEDEGLATVEFNQADASHDHECSAPEYDARALEAIYAACARKFSEPGELDKKWSMLTYLNVLTGELPRFKEHKDKIIAGIANSELGKFTHDPEELLDVFASQLQNMGFSTDKDLVQAYWQKAKQSPTGYLRSWFSWPIMADYLLETKPEILTEFDHIRINLSNHSLSQIFSKMPVNPTGEVFEKEHRRMGSLSEKIWRPILKYVDNAIMEN